MLIWDEGAQPPHQEQEDNGRKPLRHPRAKPASHRGEHGASPALAKQNYNIERHNAIVTNYNTKVVTMRRVNGGSLILKRL